MTKGFFRIVTAVIFVFCALGIGALVIFPAPWNVKKSSGEQQTRIIIPRAENTRTEDRDFLAESIAREDSISARVLLEEGEVIITVLNGFFDGSPMEKQFVAYRNLLEIESPVYITFIDYDESSHTYKRSWSAATAATRPGTISLHTLDLLGDRSVCVLLSGVNGLGEHTLTIFRLNSFQVNAGTARNELFSKIAEFRIDGTITVKEVERPQAYQMGIGRGQSFTISAYGRDFESSNILDQVEIVYSYNTGNGLYEQTSITRIPGAQVEQRRVRELLGNSQAFEEFISGLWYYLTPQGTIDKNQYIYFNPASREIIFYDDETQQVFNWQNSTATRYGLYISSQNISISTLWRSIDLELESLDGIKVRVKEDVRLKIGVIAPWDGSYRKAGPPEHQAQKAPPAGNSYIDAWYDGSIGKIRFLPNGSFELNAGGTLKQGRYAFFNLNNQEYLELRSLELHSQELYPPELRSAEPRSQDSAEPRSADNRLSDPRPEAVSGSFRETYLVEGPDSGPALRKTLSLFRVRIGAKGVERLHDGVINLSLASE